jgi:hypothetical protein
VVNAHSAYWLPHEVDVRTKVSNWYDKLVTPTYLTVDAW